MNTHNIHLYGVKFPREREVYKTRPGRKCGSLLEVHTHNYLHEKISDEELYPIWPN